MSRRRAQKAFLGAIAICALLAVGGIVGATWVKSPAQIAADARPPRSAFLTAAVSTQPVDAATVVRATVRAATATFTPQSEVGAQRLIVTHVVAAPGTVVTNGSLLAYISGRPLILLEGDFGTYRDMVQGESGPDIAELQQALLKLGYGIGDDPSGSFDTGTADAVKRLYAAVGANVIYIPGPKRSKLVEVPASEIVFADPLPARILQIGAVGTVVSPPFVTLQFGSAQVRATSSGGATYRRGDGARLVDEDTGWTSAGAVASVSSRGGGAGARLTFKTKRPLPSAMLGDTILVTVVTARSRPPYLSVPASAIGTAANGESYVTVAIDTHTRATRKVPVEIGLSGAGRVAIKGAISPSDRVVIGAGGQNDGS